MEECHWWKNNQRMRMGHKMYVLFLNGPDKKKTLKVVCTHVRGRRAYQNRLLSGLVLIISPPPHNESICHILLLWIAICPASLHSADRVLCLGYPQHTNQARTMNKSVVWHVISNSSSGNFPVRIWEALSVLLLLMLCRVLSVDVDSFLATIHFALSQRSPKDKWSDWDLDTMPHASRTRT